jgi:hypothetical protein
VACAVAPAQKCVAIPSAAAKASYSIRASSPHMTWEKTIGARCMSKPLLVTIPHRLGKDEAIRRLKSGLGSVRTNFGHVLSVHEESWTGDHLQFRVSALGQVAAGTIAVTETDVHLEVTLPWLLAQLGEKLQPILRRQGNLMLEKK